MSLDRTIGQLINGGIPTPSDITIIERSGQNFNIALSAITTDISNLVPYTGATKALDMGNWNVLAAAVKGSQFFVGHDSSETSPFNGYINIKNSSSTNYATIAATRASSNYVIDLPPVQGTSGQVLYKDSTTNGISWGNFISAGTSTAWSAITNTPTTLGGYGITDAVSNNRYSVTGLTGSTDLKHITLGDEEVLELTYMAHNTITDARASGKMLVHKFQFSVVSTVYSPMDIGDCSGLVIETGTVDINTLAISVTITSGTWNIKLNYIINK